MKNLIKLQAIVMSIEEDMNPKYKSSFDYKRFDEMTIESYCWEQTTLIKRITELLKGTIGYIESNNKITILDTNDKEGEE